MSMDKALKMKWADALESGKYLQVSGVLTDGTGFCCLGVLCEIQDPKWIKQNFDVDFVTGDNIGDMETECVPEHLAGGLNYESAVELATRNDGRKWQSNDVGKASVEFHKHTFKEIAALLREREDI